MNLFFTLDCIWKIEELQDQMILFDIAIVVLPHKLLKSVDDYIAGDDEI